MELNIEVALDLIPFQAPERKDLTLFHTALVLVFVLFHAFVIAVLTLPKTELAVDLIVSHSPESEDLIISHFDVVSVLTLFHAPLIVVFKFSHVVLARVLMLSTCLKAKS